MSQTNKNDDLVGKKIDMKEGEYLVVREGDALSLKNTVSGVMRATTANEIRSLLADKGLLSLPSAEYRRKGMKVWYYGKAYEMNEVIPGSQWMLRAVPEHGHRSIDWSEIDPSRLSKQAPEKPVEIPEVKEVQQLFDLNIGEQAFIMIARTRATPEGKELREGTLAWRVHRSPGMFHFDRGYYPHESLFFTEKELRSLSAKETVKKQAPLVQPRELQELKDGDAATLELTEPLTVTGHVVFGHEQNEKLGVGLWRFERTKNRVRMEQGTTHYDVALSDAMRVAAQEQFARIKKLEGACVVRQDIVNGGQTLAKKGDRVTVQAFTTPTGQNAKFTREDGTEEYVPKNIDLLKVFEKSSGPASIAPKEGQRVKYKGGRYEFRELSAGTWILYPLEAGLTAIKWDDIDPAKKKPKK